MKIVLDALVESLEGLKVRFGDTPESFTSDRAQTGDTREASVSELLGSYFPNNWFVRRGPIYDTTGNKSQSIDSVICSPLHPPMKTGKRTVLLAEGVHSATETKPRLETHTATSEFHRGLLQIVSVKRLHRELHPLAVPLDVRADPEHHRIPCALFTAKVGDAESAIDYMDTFKKTENVRPHELPDLIVSLDQGVILHAPDVTKSVARKVAAERTGTTSGEIYVWLPASGHHVLAWYLYLLYSFPAPEPYWGEPILRKYLSTMPWPEGFRFYRGE